MSFQVDPQKKKSTHSLIVKSKPSFYAIRVVYLFALWIGIGGTMLYFALNTMIPEWSMVNVNGVPQKDTFSIIFNSVSFIIFGSIVFLLLRALLNNVAGKEARGRVDEELSLINDVIKYTFRINFQFAASHRNIIIIPIKDITTAKYDPKTSAVQLRGRFSSDSVDDYFSGKKVTPDSGNLNEFVLYDYFTPSLLDSLKTKGVFK